MRTADNADFRRRRVLASAARAWHAFTAAVRQTAP